MLKDDILNAFNFQQCCCLHINEWWLERHHFCGACCSWASSADELFLEWNAFAAICSWTVCHVTTPIGVLARPYLITLYVIFPIYLNFPKEAFDDIAQTSCINFSFFSTFHVSFSIICQLYDLILRLHILKHHLT